MFSISNIPWGLLGAGAGALALFFFGYITARNGEKKRELRARLAQEKDLRHAYERTNRIRRHYDNKLKRIQGAFKKTRDGGDKSSFTNFVNELFGEVFKTKN